MTKTARSHVAHLAESRGIVSIVVVWMMCAPAVRGASDDSAHERLERHPFLVRTFADRDGNEIAQFVVPGGPLSDKGTAVEVPPLEPNAINVISNVPAFDYCYGCYNTAAAMLIGYYDNVGYPNMYTGTVNGGVCPMNNAAWGQYHCPFSASKQGVDGRTTRGHYDDYWGTPDPYIANGWPEHSPMDCTGDSMGTSRSAVGHGRCDILFFLWERCPPLRLHPESALPQWLPRDSGVCGITRLHGR